MQWQNWDVRSYPTPSRVISLPFCCPAALNVAWAWHDSVADYVRASLMWLEKRGQANLAALVSTSPARLGKSAALPWVQPANPRCLSTSVPVLFATCRRRNTA